MSVLVRIASAVRVRARWLRGLGGLLHWRGRRIPLRGLGGLLGWLRVFVCEDDEDNREDHKSDAGDSQG